jgi:hypothetical protein
LTNLVVVSTKGHKSMWVVILFFKK